MATILQWNCWILVLEKCKKKIDNLITQFHVCILLGLNGLWKWSVLCYKIETIKLMIWKIHKDCQHLQCKRWTLILLKLKNSSAVVHVDAISKIEILWFFVTCFPTLKFSTGSCDSLWHVLCDPYYCHMS